MPHWLSVPRQDRFTRFCIERVAGVLATRPEAQISLNLSPTQLTSPQTVTSLEGLLPDVRSRLRVELTEQRFGDTKRLSSSLALIRERCAAVLLDDITESDFQDRTATGGHVDGVKVDRSVMLGLVEGSRRVALERFISELAQRFPVVVVEGVEDAEMCDRLRELGATHVQGFGIAQPRTDLLWPLTEPRLPHLEEAAANAVRLNLGTLMLGEGDSELHS